MFKVSLQVTVSSLCRRRYVFSTCYDILFRLHMLIGWMLFSVDMDWTN